MEPIPLTKTPHNHLRLDLAFHITYEFIPIHFDGQTTCTLVLLPFSSVISENSPPLLGLFELQHDVAIIFSEQFFSST